MPEPLREHLDSPTDEARISRMWEEVRQGRTRPRPLVPMAAVGVAAMAAAAWLLWPSTPTELVLDGGAEPGVMLATDAEEISFSDGSRVALSPGARLETLENDGTRFSLLLAEGAARFEVTPGGPRRWRIEGGAATVEVVGTVFEVDRRDGGLRVNVERGVVVVRGERVPNRVVRLTRGQHLEVAPLAVASVPASDELPVEMAEAAEPPPAPPSPPRPAPVVARARPRPAAPPRGRVELAPPSTGVEGLLERAREAEARGEVHRQAALLRRVSEGDDPRAALAAFTLGRLEMDRLGHPEQARGALRRALGLGLPRRLAEQARARLRDLDEGIPPALAPRQIEPPDSLLTVPSTPE